MALHHQSRAENIPGDFFVDQSCIDCDLCRQIAPDTFKRRGDQSAVYRQPSTPETQFAALKALVTCPTSSIGDIEKHDARPAVAAFPEPIDAEVYFCGFASKSSYGASSYFIRRPGGNILIDSPRFAAPLVKRLEEAGGIKLMLLTHRDDVADHQRWAAHFRAERVLHRHDLTRSTEGVERVIAGAESHRLADDLLIIPTPGHTRGHLAFLYRDRYLFTGDHLWWSPRVNSLYASRAVCWYDWSEQTASMERLLDYDFEWVLPGHGRRFRASDAHQMKEQLKDCIRRMQWNFI